MRTRPEHAAAGLALLIAAFALLIILSVEAGTTLTRFAESLLFTPPL